MYLLKLFFFSSLITTGFFAGIGFVNAVGLMPAMEATSVQRLVEFWQALDKYMRVRMPIPGIPMLLSLVITIILLFKQKPYDGIALSLAIAALIMVVANVIITFTQNLPINLMLEKLDPNQVPAGFEVYKMKAIKIFYLRSVVMMLAFILITLSYFQYESSRQPKFKSQLQASNLKGE